MFGRSCGMMSLLSLYFFAEQFKGKIPVPPIQELFELEPNVVSKR